MHHNFRLSPSQLFRTMFFHGMKVTQINSVHRKVKYFSQSITKSSRASRQYVKLNLPTDVTHTFVSFQSNYSRARRTGAGLASSQTQTAART